MPAQPEPIVRTDLRPGDLGDIVSLHGRLYAKEYGFDASFEPYVAGPLAQFALARSPRERLWVVERDGRLAGCIAIVAASAGQAQLRWFLLDPAVRGLGLGARLLGEALAFARAQGYRSVMLWTVSGLDAALHLYRKAGFRKVGEKAGNWGVDVVEEKHLLELGGADADLVVRGCESSRRPARAEPGEIHERE